jgi:hypothetical protein
VADRLVRVAGKHVKGCRAVHLATIGDWSTCWGPLAHPVVTKWRKYGRKGTKLQKWIRFKCNDINCKAELHVEAEFILAKASTTAK